MSWAWRVDFLCDQLMQDVRFHYRVADRKPPGPLGVLLLTNPSIRAVALMRLAAGTTGLAHAVWRNLLITMHGCDVGAGATIVGPLDCPHPVGIVIGRGVRIGAGVRIFQNVTLGQSRTGKHPVLHDCCTVYAGALVVGEVSVGAGAVVGANVVVTHDVAPDAVARGRRA